LTTTSKTILVPNTDSRIENINQVIIDLTYEIQQNPDRLICTTSREGPDLEKIGLYNLLDQICEKYNYSKSKVRISTCNLLEKHPEYQIQKVFNAGELDGVRNSLSGCVVGDKTFDNRFKHFGHFIGHGNLYRLQCASYLFNNHKNQTLQTYHYTAGSDYHRCFMGIEDWMYHQGTRSEIESALNLLFDSPLTLDKIQTYPILTPANTQIYQYYKDFFVEIVNQTYFSGQVFYVDEKIWRPIYLKTPFMLQSSAGMIKNLRRLGFKTFDKWWDEGYNEDPEDCQVPAICENIRQLSKLSTAQLQQMYIEMIPTLEHNYNLCRQFNMQNLVDIFGPDILWF
jgi:hypothetical protein